MAVDRTKSHVRSSRAAVRHERGRGLNSVAWCQGGSSEAVLDPLGSAAREPWDAVTYQSRNGGIVSVRWEVKVKCQSARRADQPRAQ